MEKIQIELQFDANKHIYSDNRGTVYTSATTLIGKYKEKFDSKYWSMYVALRDSGCKLQPNPEKQVIRVDGKYRSLDSLYKNPINSYEVKKVIKKWEVLTTKACDRGNEIHDYLEDSINESKDDADGSTNANIKPSLASTLAEAGLTVRIDTKHDLDKTTIGERYPEIYDRLLMYINMGCIIFAEKKIYSTHYEIAGMIDVLIIKKGTKFFSILDWKSNKDIMMFRSGYFKKVKTTTAGGQIAYVKTDNFIDKKSYLKSPIDNLEDCKGIVYTLQLTLYAYIMELWGYKLVPNGLEIFHIRPGLRPQLIKVDYKKEEIIKVLEHHRKVRILGKPTVKKTKFGIS